MADQPSEVFCTFKVLVLTIMWMFSPRPEYPQVIVADNFFSGSKDNLRKWIGHPRFELIRHGINVIYFFLIIYQLNFLDSLVVEGTGEAVFFMTSLNRCHLDRLHRYIHDPLT